MGQWQGKSTQWLCPRGALHIFSFLCKPWTVELNYGGSFVPGKTRLLEIFPTFPKHFILLQGEHHAPWATAELEPKLVRLTKSPCGRKPATTTLTHLNPLCSFSGALPTGRLPAKTSLCGLHKAAVWGDWKILSCGFVCKNNCLYQMLSIHKDFGFINCGI